MRRIDAQLTDSYEDEHDFNPKVPARTTVLFDSFLPFQQIKYSNEFQFDHDGTFLASEFEGLERYQVYKLISYLFILY